MRPFLQPQLRVGAIDDPAERDADDAAQRLLRGERPAIAPVQVRRAVPVDSASAAAAAGRPTGGEGLPAGQREFFEHALGAPFDDVRIHADGRAGALAEGLHARAFTVGRDVFFGPDQFRPDTGEGRRLLAHELVHTVQQAGGTPAIQRQSLGDLADRGVAWAERQAERVRELGERGMGWAERQAARAERVGERLGEEAGELGERALEEAEAAWTAGTGAVARMDFDGATLRLSGTVSYSAPAVSGLRPTNPRAGGRDWTDPIHQDVPNKGPIPEGEYYVEPGEVETSGFPTGPWGFYRTRLHASLLTTAERRLFTDRTGGFFLHKDGGNDGTAGCIGLQSHTDNKVVHGYIAGNAARIPVHVAYPAAVTPPAGAAGAAAVLRSPLPPDVVAGAVVPLASRTTTLLVQRQETAAPPTPHWLVQSGLDQLADDAATYGAGGFPADYYDTLARHLFEVALRRTGRDYGAAFTLLNELQNGELGAGLQREYTRVVGTDSANGWDKVRHFVFTAYLQYHSGGLLAPEAFTYGKEIWDALEGLLGYDPEGYSVPDIRADNRGEFFAEQMRARELAEIRARSRAELERARRVFIDQNPADVLWFIQNFRL